MGVGCTEVMRRCDNPCYGDGLDREVICPNQGSRAVAIGQGYHQEHNVPPVEIKNGIKGVAKLLTKGTDERIVENATFKEILEELEVGEDYDFEMDDDLGGGRGWNIGAWFKDDEEEGHDLNHFSPVLAVRHLINRKQRAMLS